MTGVVFHTDAATIMIMMITLAIIASNVALTV